MGGLGGSGQRNGLYPGDKLFLKEASRINAGLQGCNLMLSGLTQGDAEILGAFSLSSGGKALILLAAHLL